MKTQLKPLWVLILIAVAITSCNQRDKETKDSLNINELLSENAKDFTFAGVLSEIDKDLEIVKEKSEIIELSSTINEEGEIENKEEVLKNISMINSIMDDNRKKVNELKESIGDSNKTNMDLFHLSELTKSRLEKQEESLEDLKAILNRKSFRLEDLNKRMSPIALQIEKKNDLITQLKSNVNTGYYNVGSYKSLKEKEIVEKHGGIMGIGAVKSIDEDFNQSDFNKIDITKVTKVKVDSKKAKLLTEHPVSSYEFEMSQGKVDYLKILNPKEFWRTSKYLVVETK